MSARKSSHGTIFLIVSSGSPLALIASSLRSTSKKPFCPMTRSLHRPYPRAVTESDSRARGERNFSRRPDAIFGLLAIQCRHEPCNLIRATSRAEHAILGMVVDGLTDLELVGHSQLPA